MFFDSIALVTGGFDPIHSGHIKYFENAKKLSDCLVVGLNINIKNESNFHILNIYIT